MKVSFDIGGVLSKYPKKFKDMMLALDSAGVEIYVITDMSYEKAIAMLGDNGFDFVAPGNVLCGDYEQHGERCKQALIEEHGIDMHFDDFAAYCAHPSCINLFVWPNPDLPYYADDFVTREEFKFGRARPKQSK